MPIDLNLEQVADARSRALTRIREAIRLSPEDKTPEGVEGTLMALLMCAATIVLAKRDTAASPANISAVGAAAHAAMELTIDIASER